MAWPFNLHLLTVKCCSDHILVPLNLLVFALETAITTLTCVVDVGAWTGYTALQRNDLYALYVPYLIVGE